MSEVTLTLPRRNITATLPDRDIKPQTTVTAGGAGHTLVENLLLQGFEYAGTFDTSAFLLYGLLTGSAGSTTTYLDRPGVLTLRRRPVVLEVV